MTRPPAEILAPRSRLATWALLAVVALAVGGCSMAQSTLVREMETIGCKSDAGAYYLSRSFLKVKVGGAGPGQFFLSEVSVKRHPDRAHKYCLDYLGSPTSNEGFVVERTENGLLTRLYSNSEDQSATIVKNIAKAVFVGVSQNPDFDPTATTARSAATDADEARAVPRLSDLFSAEFDPFNEHDSALVNDALNDFGFCLVIEEVTFGKGHRDIDSYCDNPLGHSKREAAMRESFAFSETPATTPIKQVRGVLYRPRVAYNLFLFVKRDLKLPAGWKLRASEAIHVENRSPIMAIGVDRAFFTTRKTGLAFDEGALYDINIDKKSELAGFVEVPLYIAQSIAALPANIIQVKVKIATSQSELEAAQARLLLAQKDQLLALKALNEQRAKLNPAPAPAPAADAARSAQTPREPASAAADAAQVQASYQQCLAGTEVAAAKVQAYCQCVYVQCLQAKPPFGDLAQCRTLCRPQAQ